METIDLGDSDIISFEEEDPVRFRVDGKLLLEINVINTVKEIEIVNKDTLEIVSYLVPVEQYNALANLIMEENGNNE